MSWRHPGPGAAILYGALAAAAGGAVASVARVQAARQVGRRSVARQLPNGPLIVVANHTSYADGVLLAIACRDLGRSLRLLATAGVFTNPLLGPVMRLLGFIPVHRGSSSAAGALDAAAQALAAGEAVGLFPEGRITRDPEHWPERSKTGAVRLALRSGAPIIPVALHGVHEVVGLRGNLVRTTRNLVLPPEVRVLVGDVIDVSSLVRAAGGEVSDAQGVDEATVRRVSDEVMARLIDLVEELRGRGATHEYGVPREEGGSQG